MADGPPLSISDGAHLSAHIAANPGSAGPGQWQLRLPELRRNARVELSADWLAISLPLGAPTRPIGITQILKRLDRNGQIEGAARIISRDLERAPEVVVEIPRNTLISRDGDDSLHRQINDLLESLRTAALAAESAGPLAAHARAAAAEELPPYCDEDLRVRLDELGWPARQTKGDDFEIPLDVPANYIAARVRRERAFVTVQVPLLPDTYPSAPPPGQAAIAVLLWLVASRIRMVKATRVRGSLGLSVTLPAAHATAAALVHGCVALSVALQQCVPESDRLRADERLARAYLRTIGLEMAARGVSPPGSCSNRRADHKCKGSTP